MGLKIATKGSGGGKGEIAKEVRMQAMEENPGRAANQVQMEV